MESQQIAIDSHQKYEIVLRGCSSQLPSEVLVHHTIVNVIRSVERFYDAMHVTQADGTVSLLEKEFYYIEYNHFMPLRVVGPVTIKSATNFFPGEPNPQVGVVDNHGVFHQLSLKKIVEHGVCFSGYEIGILFDRKLRSFKASPKLVAEQALVEERAEIVGA